MQNTKHRSQVLVNSRIQRFVFDAENPEDRIAYAVFLKTGKWTKQFYFEVPDMNVVAMCQRKLVDYAIKNDMKNAQIIIDDINEKRAKTSMQLIVDGLDAKRQVATA